MMETEKTDPVNYTYPPLLIEQREEYPIRYLKFKRGLWDGNIIQRDHNFMRYRDIVGILIERLKNEVEKEDRKFLKEYDIFLLNFLNKHKTHIEKAYEELNKYHERFDQIVVNVGLNKLTKNKGRLLEFIVFEELLDKKVNDC